MQESSIVEIFKAILTSGAVNDTHLFLIIALCIVVVIKKISSPFKETFEKISTKTDIKEIKTDLSSMNNEMEDYFKELTTDFKKISEKLDALSTKAEIHTTEINNLKSDLSQIKKYIDNIYLVSFNNKN